VHLEDQLTTQFDVPIHVENRRLFEAASGQRKMNEWEHDHVHHCEVCQGVLYVFLNQPVVKFAESEQPSEPSDAA
jgi:hypothetical protein